MTKICKELSVTYQTKPREKWTVVQQLGNMGGALNGGISKVICNNPKAQGMVFIEKRFSKEDLFARDIPRREIQILSQVRDHKYITKIVDHFLDTHILDGAVYLEYCAVGTLADVAEGVSTGSHVNEHKIWHWFYQLSSALTYCHRGPEPQMTDDEIFQSGWSRIYHRDIKPGNILLTVEEGAVIAKLADFGFATTEDYLALEWSQERALTQPGGTPGFDAPEYPLFGGPCDVWQLGLSMVCVCTGIKEPRSREAPRGQIWNKERPAGPSYSNEVNQILKKCLEEDHRKRVWVFPLVKELEHVYKTIQTQLPADKRPSRVFDAPQEHSKRMLPAGHRRPNRHFSMWQGTANLRRGGDHRNPVPFYEAGFDED